jgi:hypothetical protein
MIVRLLDPAAAEARDTSSLEELALATAQAAWLLGVLRRAGERLGAPPPHQVLAGVQGLRLWTLAIKEAQATQLAADRR